jgi:hypothetical protein
MRSTPEIPDRFRHLSFPGYTNVFSLLPDCNRFYCTETLFGDWDAQTLILAKDPAPASVIKSRVSLEGEMAWRHSEHARNDSGGWKTNERIASQCRILPGTQLYGSATANMLCDKEGWSRTLPGFRRGILREYLHQSLCWVIENMPNLRAIACIGTDSWHLTADVLGRPESANHASKYRDAERLLEGSLGARSLVASCHFHPSRGSREQWALGWKTLARHLRESASSSDISRAA